MYPLRLTLARLLALLLITLATISQPGLAQTPGNPPSPNEPSSEQLLADLLEDDTTRQQLIDRLRAANDDAAAETPEPAESPQVHQGPSLARQIATVTANAGGNIKEQFAVMGSAVESLLSGDNANPMANTAALLAATKDIAIVILATFAMFLLLRRLARPGFAGLNRWATTGSGRYAMLRTVGAVVAAAAIDALAIAGAYITGNFIASGLSENTPDNGTRLALLLNAFLIVETLKLLLRMLFAGRFPALRLLPLKEASAKYCNRVFAVLAGFTGYGILAVVPIINKNASPELGAASATLIVLFAALYFVSVVIRNKSTVAQLLANRAAQCPGSRGFALRLLARLWHVLAIFYAAAVVFASLLYPTTALPFIAKATALTGVYIGAGALLLVVIRQFIGREIKLPPSLYEPLPQLQIRLNTYVPTGLKVLRILVGAIVTILALDAWAVFDLHSWYSTDAGRSTVASLFDIVLIMILATAVWIAAASYIEHRLSPDTKPTPAAAARAETLQGLFLSSLGIVVVVMTVMIVLSEIGVEIGPLIAGAGVLGLAVGFGAQKLVQDVINGVFIQLENAINTGDYVNVGSYEGTVERVGIRSVALRDLSGTYHIVPFSAVDAVSNYTKDFAYHLGEYGIAYRENIDHAIEHLQAAFAELREGEFSNDILDDLQVAGVSALADSSVNIRVLIKTSPGMQWAVGRAYNRLVKMHFDAAGIEIPFPHTTLYFGEDKDGVAPPAQVRVAAANGEGSEELPHITGDTPKSDSN
ncbi:MAG: mechanosensitive ion channel domain-containing protein [Spongiibacter sp.]